MLPNCLEWQQERVFFCILEQFPSVAYRYVACLSLSSWDLFSTAQPLLRKRGHEYLGDQEVTLSPLPQVRANTDMVEDRGSLKFQSMPCLPGFPKIITGAELKQHRLTKFIFRAPQGLALISDSPDRLIQGGELFSKDECEFISIFSRTSAFSEEEVQMGRGRRLRFQEVERKIIRN